MRLPSVLRFQLMVLGLVLLGVGDVTGAGPLSRYGLRDVDSEDQSGHRILQFQLGSAIRSSGTLWGAPSWSGRGQFRASVSYGFDGWRGFDQEMRIDYQEYRFPGTTQPRKWSLSSIFVFPRSIHYFPLYFGLGGGLALFFNQLPGESELGLDYQLLIGLRFYRLWGSVGVAIEFNQNGHLFLLSDGQAHQSSLMFGLVADFDGI